VGSVPLSRAGSQQGRAAHERAAVVRGRANAYRGNARPLAVNGELDAVIAAGLGIDLAALNKRAASVGALAALEQTAVPLALKPGEQPKPDAALPALKNALQGELARTLGVAVPQASVGGGVIGGGTIVRGRAERPRAAEPDPLDRLIAAAAEDGDDEEEGPR